MSELRSKFPQAQAWTFVCDSTPAAEPASSTRATAAAARRQPGAPAAPAVRSNKSSGSRITSRGAQGQSMGGLCSSNKNGVANKENVRVLRDEEATAVVPSSTATGTQTAEMRGGDMDAGGPTRAALDGSAGEGSGSVNAYTPATSKEAQIGGIAETSESNDGDSRLGGTQRDDDSPLLDSTAFLSPDPCHADSDSHKKALQVDELDEAEGMPLEEETGALEEGSDRSAWLTRSLGQLRAGKSVDVAQLKQLSGLEDCLHELLSERARHLKAMENLTLQLTRREAEVEKFVHDKKALTTRLECAEQDRTSLEQRARAAVEEHRVDRARWFVHKQELETRCVQLESRDSQYRAAIRKKELDYGRLQDSMRRVVQKDSRAAPVGKGTSRGIEANFDLSPGEATTEEGKAPLGGVLNQQALRRAEGLEQENATLRSMLVDLQAEVMDMKGYHERHGDLVSAGRASQEGIWDGDGDPNPLPQEAIEGMPADWLQRQLGEETARQIMGMRGAVSRVLGEDKEGADGESMPDTDLTSLVSQLREARSLLREQDAIMLAAIFDRPGAEAAIASQRQRCVCGAEAGGVGGSGMWDTHERLEQDREELERERSKLEKDKARFLEEAVRRDSKSFVFSCTPATPGSPADAAGVGAGDIGLSTPGRYHRHLAASGTLMVPSTPCPNVEEGGGLPLLTFTPPAASPATTRLLCDIGIEAGGRGPP